MEEGGIFAVEKGRFLYADDVKLVLWRIRMGVSIVLERLLLFFCFGFYVLDSRWICWEG